MAETSKPAIRPAPISAGTGIRNTSRALIGVVLAVMAGTAVVGLVFLTVGDYFGSRNANPLDEGRVVAMIDEEMEEYHADDAPASKTEPPPAATPAPGAVATLPPPPAPPVGATDPAPASELTADEIVARSETRFSELVLECGEDDTRWPLNWHLLSDEEYQIHIDKGCQPINPHESPIEAAEVELTPEQKVQLAEIAYSYMIGGGE